MLTTALAISRSRTTTARFIGVSGLAAGYVVIPSEVEESRRSTHSTGHGM
ncbi:MAG: hypothetical protein AVDCRST_MAG42-662 [uncultured Chthoniobacterales bacterium]|uniref:Uncharacterized protein n=1 Tax=uncultured Chthoniobacterales bacterium TaxID=1836801 RepID=A0A6J4HFC5_9BACT|nr:MAG: hypothetical protein AVDCRST_MAG42-662 [uncultured Chthoniobacterales bacterium]